MPKQEHEKMEGAMTSSAMEDHDAVSSNVTVATTPVRQQPASAMDKGPSLPDAEAATADSSVDKEQVEISAKLQNMTMTAASPPPRASFMGLPVELRLRIYGYLLTPYLTEEQRRAFREGSLVHCCYSSLKGNHVACVCTAKNLHPQVLAVCHQVRVEATPILYQNLEVRIWSVYDCYTSRMTREKLEQLPHYAKEYVTRLNALVFASDGAPGSDRGSELQDWLDYLSPSFPNIKHIQLRVDVWTADWKLYGVPAEEYRDAFAVLMTLASLESVHAEIHLYDTDLTLIAAKVENGLRQAATARGKAFSSVQLPARKQS